MGHAYSKILTRRSEGLWDGLTNMWELNGNAVDSITGMDSTMSGTGVTYYSGKINKAAYFNGSSWFTINAEIFINSGFTFSCWVYSTTSSRSIMGLLSSHIGINAYGFRLYDKSRACFTPSSNKVTIDNLYSGPYVINGSWFHICFRSGSKNVYINGEERPLTWQYLGAADTTVPDELYIPKPIYIGTDGYDTTNRSFQGYLEQVCIWDRILTVEEVLKLYNNGAGLSYS